MRDHKWREGLFQGLHSIQRVASVCKVSSEMPSSGGYSILHTPYSQYHAIIRGMCEDTR
jgi:hypothetical protein